MNWNAEQCGTTKCKWSQVMTKIFFHNTVIQCPAIASLHGYNLYIYTKGRGKEEGNAWLW